MTHVGIPRRYCIQHKSLTCNLGPHSVNTSTLWQYLCNLHLGQWSDTTQSPAFKLFLDYQQSLSTGTRFADHTEA